MKKALVVIALFGFTVLGVAGTAAAQEKVQLGATLSGANEVGDPGDSLGTGSATITVDAATNEVCFDIAVANIDPVVAGHIHSGGAGSNGDVVVNFNLDATTTTGCVTSDAATVASILNTPELFYVNVHTAQFPAGAIRGQLSGPAAAPAAAETAAPAAADTTAAAETTEELAFTGDVTGVLALVGSALVAGGAAMVIVARRQD